MNSSLGIPATNVGPLGNMSIARRVVFDAHTLLYVLIGTRQVWDAIAIPGHTTISTISLALCGYDGNLEDLNGQPWSCSIIISMGE